MSLPTFPVDPEDLTREGAINQILSSIAMEEVGLSHILNAEGEKLQFILGTLPYQDGSNATIDQVLQANDSVQSLLRAASYNQMFLNSKMQTALDAATAAPSGSIPAGETVFNVGLGDGNTIPLKFGDDLEFTSDTLGITLTEGSVHINIELPEDIDDMILKEFAAADAATYKPGELIQYEGQVYLVTGTPAAGDMPGISPAFAPVNGAKAFDAAEALNYIPGDLVYTDGNQLYLVNSAPGTTDIPSKSASYTLIGPIGGAQITVFAAADATTYAQYQLIYHNGQVYFVNEQPDNEDEPGVSGNYTPLLGKSSIVPVTFVAGNYADYVPGELIQYKGQIYYVKEAPVNADTPDISSAYAVVGPAVVPENYLAANSPDYLIGELIQNDGELYIVKAVPTETDLLSDTDFYTPVTPAASDAVSPKTFVGTDAVDYAVGELVWSGDAIYRVSAAPTGPSLPEDSTAYTLIGPATSATSGDYKGEVVSFCAGPVNWTMPTTWPFVIDGIDLTTFGETLKPVADLLQTVVNILSDTAGNLLIKQALEAVVGSLESVFIASGLAYVPSLEVLTKMLVEFSGVASTPSVTLKMNSVIGNANVGTQIVLGTEPLDIWGGMVAGPPYELVMPRAGFVKSFEADFDALAVVNPQQLINIIPGLSEILTLTENVLGPILATINGILDTVIIGDILKGILELAGLDTSALPDKVPGPQDLFQQPTIADGAAIEIIATLMRTSSILAEIADPTINVAFNWVPENPTEKIPIAVTSQQQADHSQEATTRTPLASISLGQVELAHVAAWDATTLLPATGLTALASVFGLNGFVTEHNSEETGSFLSAHVEFAEPMEVKQGESLTVEFQIISTTGVALAVIVAAPNLSANITYL